MVLGVKGKNRSGPSVKVEYLIHVSNIKPWPPTQSLKSVRSVLIQWENGDRNSGCTNAVPPSISDGKIEFNESFRLPVVLSRDISVKNGDAEVYHKNLVEFNLYETRRDKTVKGQLLGTAIVDLAEYGVISEAISITVPMNCTRSFRNTAQLVLYLKIQPYDKARSGLGSTLRSKLEKESSLDKDVGDSVSALISEEYADEAEGASLTDDDGVSSHSSLTASSALESNGASPSQNRESQDGTERGKDATRTGSEDQDDRKLNMRMQSDLNDYGKDESSHAISVEGSSGPASPTHAPASLSDTSELEFESNSELASASRDKNVTTLDASENVNSENDAQPPPRRKSSSEVAATATLDDMKAGEKYVKSEQELVMEEQQKQLTGYKSPLVRDRPRHVKSVRSPMDSARSNGTTASGFKPGLKQEAKVYPAEKGNGSPYSRAIELEQRLKTLEGELVEAAGMEVALYSVVAEHGSSTNKVHAPARRLCRLYFQAEEGMRRASTARSAVSGLVVVAKACGNDVPRLTFWLSNCVVFRAIVSEAFEEDSWTVSASCSMEQNGNKKGTSKKPSTLNWKVSSSGKKGNRGAFGKCFEDWEDPQMLLFALEKVESWIFSRIVESVWWQTLTPHMQSSAAKVIDKILDSGSRGSYRRTSSSCDQDQVNLSLELWKKAFKDACERLCPLRGGGHECGCLPVLAKLVRSMPFKKKKIG